MTLLSQPKKKRKLFIVDMDDLETFKKTLGQTHSQLQQHILNLAEQHKVPLEKIPDQVWITADRVFNARTQEEAEQLVQVASKCAIAAFSNSTASEG